MKSKLNFTIVFLGLVCVLLTAHYLRYAFKDYSFETAVKNLYRINEQVENHESNNFKYMIKKNQELNYPSTRKWDSMAVLVQETRQDFLDTLHYTNSLVKMQKRKHLTRVEMQALELLYKKYLSKIRTTGLLKDKKDYESAFTLTKVPKLYNSDILLGFYELGVNTLSNMCLRSAYKNASESSDPDERKIIFPAGVSDLIECQYFLMEKGKDAMLSLCPFKYYQNTRFEAIINNRHIYSKDGVGYYSKKCNTFGIQDFKGTLMVRRPDSSIFTYEFKTAYYVYPAYLNTKK